MRKVTLVNTFHGTRVTLYLRHGVMTPRQYARAKQVLCGMSECTCGSIVPRSQVYDTCHGTMVSAVDVVMAGGEACGITLTGGEK